MAQRATLATFLAFLGRRLGRLDDIGGERFELLEKFFSARAVRSCKALSCCCKSATERVPHHRGKVDRGTKFVHIRFCSKSSIVKWKTVTGYFFQHQKISGNCLALRQIERFVQALLSMLDLDLEAPVSGT